MFETVGFALPSLPKITLKFRLTGVGTGVAVGVGSISLGVVDGVGAGDSETAGEEVGLGSVVGVGEEVTGSSIAFLRPNKETVATATTITKTKSNVLFIPYEVATCPVARQRRWFGAAVVLYISCRR